LKQKGITAIFIILLMVISTTTVTGLVITTNQSVSLSSEEVQLYSSLTTQNLYSEIEKVDTSAITDGFYDDIGAIYNGETDDGITIKVLRYHPAGEGFNTGGKAVLLFPGLCININQYLTRTTPDLEERYGPIELPDTLATWAQGDENIEEDPMLYYSYAYYLWSQGYDPWFANYRGIGYGEMKSESAGSKVSLDDFGLLDVEAAVEKVYEVTGKHPYVGGHSTGGLTPLMYVQGTYYRWDGHVRSSSNLVEERNGLDEGEETVSGFIGLDPAWIPGLTKLVDNYFLWLLARVDIALDLRTLIELLMDGIPMGEDLIAWLLNLITDQFGAEISNIVSYLLDLDTSNVSEEILYYFLTTSVDTLYLRTLAHYLDFIAHDTVRECYKNGWFNEWITRPPAPGGWFDSYYYYIDNTDKMSIPSIIFLATEENNLMDLVNGATVVRDVHNGKTRNANDELYWIEGAHIDMPIGLRAPVDLFPKLGAWLAVA
jgi:hypothetical protein